MRYGVVRRCNRLIAYDVFRRPVPISQWIRAQHTTSNDQAEEKPLEPDTDDLGRLIEDDFAAFKAKYQTPKNPFVLAHGLLGFDELRLVGQYAPGIQYWRGIKEALAMNNIEVITTHVPATGSIEDRARELGRDIAVKARGKKVNIVAHSMGGLDARYLISRLKPKEFEVLSLTTIATPHRGSSVADMILRDIGVDQLPRIYALMAFINIDSGAFSQLSRKYLEEDFNRATPDDPSVRYFSYGASAKPSMFSIFRLSHDLLDILEGPNDGLVSVKSSKWGKDGYRGTLLGVTHLDLINWTNRLKQLFFKLTFQKQNFNAIAFYLGVADMLAKEGL